MQNEAFDIKRIFSIGASMDFDQLCLDVFVYQYQHNEIYRRYCDLIGVTPSWIAYAHQIPFLPIELFKTHQVIACRDLPALVFESSGTTGSIPSRHYVANPGVYNTSLLNGFELQYGPIEGYCLLALLPSYLERTGSSLVYMANKLMQASGHPQNEFYMHNYRELAETMESLITANQPSILLGVSFALLEFSENYPIQSPDHFIIIETGGMKGRGKELVREELHQILCERFRIDTIHSEYGMTELLSQAYAREKGLFRCPPWMGIEIRDINDPFRKLGYNKTGGINVIDLANIYSCSFIETQDLGCKHEDGCFEVLGRFDISETRGCNLLF